MRQKGFASILAVILILVTIGVVLLMKSTPSTPNFISTPTTTPSPTANSTPITGDKFDITARSEEHEYKYSFRFERQVGDKVKQLENNYQTEIARGDAKLNIGVGFEGTSSPYESIPEHVIVNNLKLTKLPVIRVMTAASNYLYATNFGVGEEGCSQWKPLPAACSSNNISGSNESFYITCESLATEVKNCDEIFKSLSYTWSLIN